MAAPLLWLSWNVATELNLIRDSPTEHQKTCESSSFELWAGLHGKLNIRSWGELERWEGSGGVGCTWSLFSATSYHRDSLVVNYPLKTLV